MSVIVWVIVVLERTVVVDIDGRFDNLSGRRSTIQMTLKMTSTQVVETSVNVNNKSFQNYTNPDNHTQQNIQYY